MLRYAAVAIDAARRLFDEDLEVAFVERLATVRSANHAVDGAALWHRAVDAARVDDERVAAAAAAQWVAGVGASRHERGVFTLTVEPADDLVRVTTTHRPTMRRRTVEFDVRQVGPFAWRVRNVAEPGVEFTEADFGEDVVARLAMASLLGARHLDVEGALNELATQLLARAATAEDERALVSLAGAARYVTPIGEAAIRRALLALRATRGPGGWSESLTELAGALGFEATGSSGG